MRRGATVLELGCWPGGWLQILAREVGPEGRVIGVDLRPVDPLGPPVETLELDFTSPEAPGVLEDALGGAPAAILSDAAPKKTGIIDLDRGAEEELYESALYLAERLLDPGGLLIMKGFPGPGADRMRGDLRTRFDKVSEVRPEGKRQTSKEFYWLAAGLRPS